MGVANTDLVLYTSQNMPTSDSGTSGGAIETTNKVRPVFSTGQISGGNSQVEAASNGTSDGGGKLLRVTGRNAAGAIITEDIAISATANSYAQAGSPTTFERILFARFLTSGAVATTATGTLTLRKASAGAVISTIAAGEHGVRVVFYDASGPASGSSENNYEKIYARNNNSSFDLTNATVAMTADPSTVMEWGFSVTSASQSVSDRTQAPSGVTFITTTAATTVPALASETATAGAIAATEAKGLWLKLTMDNTGGTFAALNSSVTLQIVGTSV